MEHPSPERKQWVKISNTSEKPITTKSPTTATTPMTKTTSQPTKSNQTFERNLQQKSLPITCSATSSTEEQAVQPAFCPQDQKANCDDINLGELGEFEYGCDKKRLCESRALGLHKELGNMHLYSSTQPAIALDSAVNPTDTHSELVSWESNVSEETTKKCPQRTNKIHKAQIESNQSSEKTSRKTPEMHKVGECLASSTSVKADEEATTSTGDKAEELSTIFTSEMKTVYQQTYINPTDLTTNPARLAILRDWPPAPFLKSQSLDYFVELPFKQKLQQLSEINRIRSTDTKTLEVSTLVEQTAEANEAKSENIDVNPSFSNNLPKINNGSSKLQTFESRPIFPNVPYSPYGSPYGSPNSNRRRPPLRESRRISIEQSGSFLQLNQYKLMDQIGQGSYGLVKLAYSEEDSTHYAMKILSKRRLLRQVGLMRRGPKKTTSPLDRVYREIAVLKKLDHPNVVKLVEVLDDPMEDSLYMVFELVKQGEVLRIPTVKPLNEERTWSIFRETLLGLEYLHFQRIIHADLKPGNLLLTECGHVKIADLGVCNEFFGDDATIKNSSTAGTPAFRAPETLNLERQSYCGKAADIWALGVTLFSLVFGNIPFIANSIPILYEKIKNDPVLFPDTIQISDELRDCLNRMLTKDATKRIVLAEIKVHPWVTRGGVYPLPSEDENCRLVQVSDEDINSVVRSIPKLDTLILIKTMLKKHSFCNPFLRSDSGRSSQGGGSRLERFVRAGRSNSAPGAYNSATDRQFSSDKILPSLSELTTSTNNEDS